MIALPPVAPGVNPVETEPLPGVATSALGADGVLISSIFTDPLPAFPVPSSSADSAVSVIQLEPPAPPPPPLYQATPPPPPARRH